MAVLITGVAGFIGFHVADRLLVRGEEVVGIDSLNNHYSVALKSARLAELERLHTGFKFIKLDFTEFESLTQALHSFDIRRVIHLGARVGVRQSIVDPRAYARDNLVGHANVLEWAARRRVDHLVYASTSAVYGSTSELPFRVGERTDRPLSVYGATKKSDELMSESYAHLHRLPQTGLRFFTAYGPWGRPDMALWLFADAIHEGRPVQLYNDGRMRRDFTFIDDIARGVELALDRPPVDDGRVKPGGSQSPHSLYNIARGRSEPLSAVVDILEIALGKAARRELLPMQPGDVPETHADLTETAAQLGYAPSIDIAEGIPRFVEWLQEHRARP